MEREIFVQYSKLIMNRGRVLFWLDEGEVDQGSGGVSSPPSHKAMAGKQSAQSGVLKALKQSILHEAFAG